MLMSLDTAVHTSCGCQVRVAGVEFRKTTPHFAPLELHFFSLSYTEPNQEAASSVDHLSCQLLLLPRLCAHILMQFLV